MVASEPKPSSKVEINQLVEKHLSLVQAIARKVKKTLNASIDVDDLVGYGSKGLVEAAERFDPRHGVAFSTFAYYRIRGAMYDGLRSMGWYSRADYARYRAEELLLDLPAADRGEANYLLTSAAVEVRAQVFYPIYDERLRTHEARFSVAAIMKDEGRHLEEMSAGLAGALGDWRARLAPLLAVEETLFARFLDAIAAALATAGGGRRAA